MYTKCAPWCRICEEKLDEKQRDYNWVGREYRRKLLPVTERLSRLNSVFRQAGEKSLNFHLNVSEIS